MKTTLALATLGLFAIQVANPLPCNALILDCSADISSEWTHPTPICVAPALDASQADLLIALLKGSEQSAAPAYEHHVPRGPLVGPIVTECSMQSYTCTVVCASDSYESALTVGCDDRVRSVPPEESSRTAHQTKILWHFSVDSNETCSTSRDWESVCSDLSSAIMGIRPPLPRPANEPLDDDIGDVRPGEGSPAD